MKSVKVLKRVLCVIFSLAIVFSLASVMAASAAGNEPVARLYLCSNWRKLYSTPHAFIYVENLSGKDIKVGAYTCHKGEGVSVGTSAFAQINGFGVYYNLESYNGNKRGLDNCVYMVRDITASELSNMSDFIVNHNYWEAIALNCVYFAVGCWNSAGGDHIMPIDLPPHILRAEIKNHPHGQDDLKMYYPDSSRVYKQRGGGSGAYLEPVRDSALNCSIG